MLAVRVYNSVATGGDPTWHQVIDLIGEKGGSTMAACLGLSAISVEGINMVLAELFKRKRREESEGEARSKARLAVWSRDRLACTICGRNGCNAKRRQNPRALHSTKPRLNWKASTGGSPDGRHLA